jgi:hypothetical protein
MRNGENTFNSIMIVVLVVICSIILSAQLDGILIAVKALN